MDEQAGNYTPKIPGAPGAPDWSEVREIRHNCGPATPLLGFVARRVSADQGSARSFAPVGDDPSGRLDPCPIGGFYMPPEPGYCALFVVNRTRRFAQRKLVSRVGYAVLSAPVNIVRCRACGESVLLNLADLQQRLPADVREPVVA